MRKKYYITINNATLLLCDVVPGSLERPGFFILYVLENIILYKTQNGRSDRPNNINPNITENFKMKITIIATITIAVIVLAGCAAKNVSTNVTTTSRLDYAALLDSAKTLFKKGYYASSQDELDQFDFHQVISILEEVIELNPNSSEAWYFLGHTYAAINSRDGRHMIVMDSELVYKVSESMERVIALTPKYTGEIIALDPYSKLTSEWGAMAISYWHNNKPDSAIWAFNEGKRRGGFNDFTVEYNRSMLDACDSNAILMSYGDMATIPLWYLQIVENYRTDIAVVNISLLNTVWYPAFLSENEIVAFDLHQNMLDTIEYTEWTDTAVTIGDFSWIVRSRDHGYLLRGDRLFLSLLRENNFQRSVYFTSGFAVEEQLSLTNFLSPLIVVDKVSIFDNESLSYEEYKVSISKYLSLSEYLNLNSTNELRVFDYLRHDILTRAKFYLDNNDTEKAAELMRIFDEFASGDEYPYPNENWNIFIDAIRQGIADRE